MPNVNVTPRNMSDGSRITDFTDSVGSSYVTFTYPVSQETFTIYNRGIQPILYTVGSYTDITVNPGESSTQSVSFTSFQVKSQSGVQRFEVVTDETGDTFDQPGLSNINKQIGNLLGFIGLSNYRLDYTYNADNSVNTVTTKDGNGNVVMTTTYAYLANGDVDTSTSVVNGQTITIKFNYDANGNVSSQVPTIS